MNPAAMKAKSGGGAGGTGSLGTSWAALSAPNPAHTATEGKLGGPALIKPFVPGIKPHGFSDRIRAASHSRM